MPKNDNIIPFLKGKFSQWTISPMIVDDITYNCCEQFMMACKARHFKDNETLCLIMKTDSPFEQKKLGREVKRFNKEEWDKVARDYVFKGNYAKFTQNKELMDKLLGTGDKMLVEANPYDAIWGVALSKDDDRIWDQNQWQGKNWLGEVLMQVRAKIRERLS